MSWDKRWVRRAFGKAAADYDRLAVLQRRIGGNLFDELPDLSAPGWVVDLGTGTGWCGRHLLERYPERPLLALDMAEGMVRQARKLSCRGDAAWVVGDMEALPLAAESTALVMSNLALQWCLRPRCAIAEVARVLRPGGRLLLSTFVSGTLEELRLAWSRVDDYTHVNRFIALDTLEACVAAAGFHSWRVWAQPVRLEYPSPMALFHELRGIGAHNVTSGRPRYLMGKGRLKALLQAYPREDGMVPATFVPAYVVAVR